MASVPSVSVVVSTRVPWPGLEPAIDALRDQLVTLGAELVIVDGTERGDALEVGAAVIPPASLQVVCRPGADIFELRAHGLVAANGEIVAMTEDHCVVAADYLVAVLRAHAEHTEPAVSGAIFNGTAERWIDEANFLITHAGNLPPRASAPFPGWAPTSSNISYKRGSLPTEVPRPGWLETVHNVEILQRHEVVIDDRIVVWHHQSTGRLGTFRNHFHAAKSMGGMACTSIGSRRAQLRWGLRSAIGLPARLIGPAWQVRRRDPSQRTRIPFLLPLLVMISAAAAVGLVCGVLAGPGRSRYIVQ